MPDWYQRTEASNHLTVYNVWSSPCISNKKVWPYTAIALPNKACTFLLTIHGAHMVTVIDPVASVVWWLKRLRRVGGLSTYEGEQLSLWGQVTGPNFCSIGCKHPKIRGWNDTKAWTGEHPKTYLIVHERLHIPKIGHLCWGDRPFFTCMPGRPSTLIRSQLKAPRYRSCYDRAAPKEKEDNYIPSKGLSTLNRWCTRKKVVKAGWPMD